MLNLTKKCMLWVAAIMIIAGLAVPHVCLADNVPASSEHVMMVKADVDQHSDTSKADHCCVSHHCCAGKLASHTAVEWVVPSASKAVMPYPVSQNAAGHIPQGLERPPKAIL